METQRFKKTHNSLWQNWVKALKSWLCGLPVGHGSLLVLIPCIAEQGRALRCQDREERGQAMDCEHVRAFHQTLDAGPWLHWCVCVQAYLS